MGAYCGNGWKGVVRVLYSELKAKAALELAALGFNTPSEAKLKLKAEAVLEFNASTLVDY